MGIQVWSRKVRAGDQDVGGESREDVWLRDRKAQLTAAYRGDSSQVITKPKAPPSPLLCHPGVGLHPPAQHVVPGWPWPRLEAAEGGRQELAPFPTGQGCFTQTSTHSSSDGLEVNLRHHISSSFRRLSGILD